MLKDGFQENKFLVPKSFKVPEEFVLQHTTNGNPPILFFVLRYLLRGMKRNKFTATERDHISSFLEWAFVRLEAWFQWFNTTQSALSRHCPSGLDDYPRASNPSEEERHLDLRCWMFLAKDCMYSISKLLGEEKKLGKEYGSTAKLLFDFDLLNQMHFDDAYGAYFDFGNHTEKENELSSIQIWSDYPQSQNIRCIYLLSILLNILTNLLITLGSIELARSRGNQPLCKSRASPGSFGEAKFEVCSSYWLTLMMHMELILILEITQKRKMNYRAFKFGSIELARSRGNQPLCKSRASPGSFGEAKFEVCSSYWLTLMMHMELILILEITQKRKMNYRAFKFGSIELARSRGNQPLCKSRASPGSFGEAKFEASSILEQQLNLISNQKHFMD
ncbi:uncharacterized protein LOC130779399 [Actinidia eriantha]|uniref:uncharacterized protein LOC130779399 n=1 Tax=Actinidia eriantha TaxID=165200 RepID=UPI0025873430|nr:uncharacterized protein LOC130779399 [Actinidia eriantha]